MEKIKEYGPKFSALWPSPGAKVLRRKLPTANPHQRDKVPFKIDSINILTNVQSTPPSPYTCIHE